MEHVGVEERVSVVVDEREISVADSESVSSGSNSEEQFGVFIRNGMIRLEERNSEHHIIKNSFLLGMKQLNNDTTVLAIHKNTYASHSGQARMASFRVFSEAVAKKCGGNANIKYAWYGASRNEICEIISHGFSRCRGPVNGELSGSGIYLSPAKSSIDGTLSSVPDENGLRHLLLCRVILGKMEVVRPGSKQFGPCSKEFDSGVDNLSAPRRYVVWSAYMNSHIVPNYIITFKAPCVEGSQRMRAPVLKPTSPWMRFPALISMLSRFLPPSAMTSIATYHNAYLENKITRLQFIQKLRQMAGDGLLTAIIKSCINKQTVRRTGS